MAKNSIADWDTTASGNTDVGGISIAGTAPPSNIDDGMREIMAQVAEFIGTPTLAQENLGSGLLSGHRNLIINPLGGINQRAKSGTVILTAGNYGHDRYKAGASGCTYTFSTSNGVTTFNISAGTLQQVVEASCFAGRQGDYILSWQGTSQARINSGAYGASGAVSATCDGSANVTVEWGTGTMSLPQFERGFVTDFSARHIEAEFGFCQWYYAATVGHVRFNATGGGQSLSSSVYWPTTMRATPAAATSGGSFVNAASLVILSPSRNGARLNLSSSAAGDSYALDVSVTGDAEL